MSAQIRFFDRVGGWQLSTVGWAALAVLVGCPIAACGGPEPEPLEVSDGLVFIRRSDAGSEVMRVRISDGATRHVTRSDDSNERWPYWSEAAGKLVYQREDDQQGSRLFLWDPERDRSTPLTPHRDRDERWPVWSPDGARLVFAFLGRQPAAGLASISLDAGELTLLATTGSSDFFFRPSFSPDGRSLVAQRRSAEGAGSSIWVLPADGAARAVTGDPGWFDMKPWFTRTGDSIVFSRRPASGGKHDIFAVSRAGGSPRSIVVEASDDHSARPSPTRDEIAFVSDRDGSYDVFLADLDGSNLLRLTHSDERDEFAPRWSPDGQRLVVTAGRRGASELGDAGDLHLVVLDRSGQPLLDVPGEMADWMPPWH